MDQVFLAGGLLGKPHDHMWSRRRLLGSATITAAMVAGADLVGVSHVHGTGVGVTGGVSKNLNFDIDCRFLKGHFVGTDDKLHRGTFAFV